MTQLSWNQTSIFTLSSHAALAVDISGTGRGVGGGKGVEFGSLLTTAAQMELEPPPLFLFFGDFLPFFVLPGEIGAPADAALASSESAFLRANQIGSAPTCRDKSIH